MLHYYPASPIDGQEEDQSVQDSFCGTHIDHSLLTGLCGLYSTRIVLFSPALILPGSAMYLSRTGSGSEPIEVTAPTPTAGLYIHPRGSSPSSDRGSAIKVAIPPDCLGGYASVLSWTIADR